MDLTFINLAETLLRRTGSTGAPEPGSASRAGIQVHVLCQNLRASSGPFARAFPSGRSPLLHCYRRLRGRLIGRTPDFGSGYPGSSPGPGANSLLCSPGCSLVLLFRLRRDLRESIVAIQNYSAEAKAGAMFPRITVIDAADRVNLGEDPALKLDFNGGPSGSAVPPLRLGCQRYCSFPKVTKKTGPAKDAADFLSASSNQMLTA